MALLKRLAHFLAKPPQDPAVAALYRACVMQARTPEFYRNLVVPDTIDGRFDLLVLHVFLVMRCLGGGAAAAKQQLFDLMFADMDQSLREMGVGDMGVGKRMKSMIAAFYGRAQAYEKAFVQGDEALAAALARNLYGAASAPPVALQAITGYVRRTAAALDAQPLAEVLEGRILFSSPLEERRRMA